MKKRDLPVLLTCIDLLLVQCLGFHKPLTIGHLNSGQRVLNGQYAKTEDFQFLVRLSKGSRSCAGSVIAYKSVLTSATCIMDMECPGIEIYPSTWVEGHVANFHGFKCFINSQFSYPDFFYNIAVVQTKEDLLRNDDFATIPLPAPGTVFNPGTKAVIVGWGVTADGSFSNHLMTGSVYVEHFEACNTKYKLAAPLCLTDRKCPLQDLPETVMCTQGYASTPSGTCYGDFGGPLVVDGTLAGVVLGTVLNNTKCMIGGVTLYSSVVKYLPWIEQMIRPRRKTIRY